MNLLTSLWLLLSFQVVGLYPQTGIFSESSVDSLDYGGLHVYIHSHDFLREEGATSTYTKSGISFTRHKHIQTGELACTPVWPLSQASSYVLLIPEWQSSWLGSLDPTQKADPQSLEFLLISDSQQQHIPIYVSQYKKLWLSEHSEDQTHFYIGTLRQKYEDSQSSKTMSITLLTERENISSLQFCLSKIFSGTDIELHGVHLLLLPTEPSHENLLQWKKEKEEAELHLQRYEVAFESVNEFLLYKSISELKESFCGHCSELKDILSEEDWDFIRNFQEDSILRDHKLYKIRESLGEAIIKVKALIVQLETRLQTWETR